MKLSQTKTNELLEHILENANQLDLENLRRHATLEKNKKKQRVYLSLFNYALGQRQKKFIKRKRFIR